MIPIDFRNATYEHLRTHLTGLREKVWVAWIAHGPATTREAAKLSGIDLLTFRPRTTELYQLGGVCLAEDTETRRHGDAEKQTDSLSASPRLPISASSTEGRYRARTEAEWRAWLAVQQHNLTTEQMQLPIDEQAA